MRSYYSMKHVIKLMMLSSIITLFATSTYGVPLNFIAGSLKDCRAIAVGRYGKENALYILVVGVDGRIISSRLYRFWLPYGRQRISVDVMPYAVVPVNGGYLILGRALPHGGIPYGLIVKVTVQGDLEWAVTLRGESPNYFVDGIELNRGYVVVGYTYDKESV